MGWVVLIGYMGAGKSTVGRDLAGALDREFVDSDAEIEREAGTDIPRIFSTRGELWFRRTEERTIRTILERMPPGVLAVGGGAVENARTRDLLMRSARVVWLQAPPEALWDRVSGSDRPLAPDRDRFLRRYLRREAMYAQAADLTVDATQPPASVVAQLLAWAEGAPTGTTT